MTTFTATGHMGQTLVSFTWTDGKVTSDNEWALFIFNIHAQAMEAAAEGLQMDA